MKNRYVILNIAIASERDFADDTIAPLENIPEQRNKSYTAKSLVRSTYPLRGIATVSHLRMEYGIDTEAASREEENEDTPPVLPLERQVIMGRIPTGVTIWSLKRYTKDENLWDRTCSTCKQTTPVFEYEHRDEQERSLFSYLCTACAEKKLAQWLQGSASPDDSHPGSPTDFDSALVFYEPKNDGETLLLTRWSPEQRRRRLQVEE